MPTKKFPTSNVNPITAWRSPKTGKAISPAYQTRLSRKMTKTQFESGASPRVARGHGETPEHGLREAVKRPAKFRQYIDNRSAGMEIPQGKNEPTEARRREVTKTIKHIQQEIGNYHSFRPNAVNYNVSRMTYAEMLWTQQASADDIQGAASDKNHPTLKGRNPWYYHSSIEDYEYV